jgi:hypothetical protein
MRTAVLVLLSSAFAAPASAHESTAEEAARSASAGSMQSSSLRAYADPTTGEMVSPEPANLARGSASASEREQAPVVVPAPTDAGGVMVDLRGRFRHATRLRADGDGNVSADCIPSEPPP